jgi:hypothetical protein
VQRCPAYRCPSALEARLHWPCLPDDRKGRLMASVSVMTVPGKARYVGTRIAISPIGKLAQPPRTALTGQTTSPGMFDVLAPMGRSESHARNSAPAAASAGKV